MTNTTETGFDHFSQEVAADPWPVWDRMREQDGLHSDLHGGFHIACRYADVVEVLTDTGRFSSAQGVQLPVIDMPLIPVAMDPPEHQDYRAILNPPFAPQSVRLMEPWIRDMVRELIAGFGTEIEFVSGYAVPLVQRVAMRVLGFPDEDFKRIQEWTDAIFHDREEANVDVPQLIFSYLTEHLARSRAGQPGDDLTNVLLRAEVDGKALEDWQILSCLALLLSAGLHTTAAAISGMVHWLAEHPEDRRRLLSDPELYKSAVDEFVRWVSPVPYLIRTATEETNVAGCPVRTGDRMMVFYGSANHDPANFEHPDEVQLDRMPNRHVGFGRGVHRCVGSHLARLIMRVSAEELLVRFPDFTVADPDALQYQIGEAAGLSRLPISFATP